MKILIPGLTLSLYLLVSSVAAETQLKVAYPTTVGSMAAGVVTTRSCVRESPDIVRRYLRPYVEGLHRLKQIRISL
jgi:hypothetical protein